MDRNSSGSESKRSMSFSRTSSINSSLRRLSFNRSAQMSSHIDDDIESKEPSEAGDIGDRVLQSRRFSDSFKLDDTLPENGIVFPICDGNLLHHQLSWSRNSESLNGAAYPTESPRPGEIKSPLPTDAFCQKHDEVQKPLPMSLEYCSSLIHLALFGILGVLTRYLLQKLFSPRIAQLTSNGSVLYLDLPSNMVGSFLMGWVGVVFKGDIIKVSEYLTIGLSTGYLGSLTTFSGWNQKMLDLSIEGKWQLAFLGFLIGLFLSAYSIIFGIETAKGFRWLIGRIKADSGENPKIRNRWRVHTFRSQIASMTVMLLLLGLLWTVSAILLEEKFHKGGSEPQLWLACIVAPVGVWIRWFLARINGRGIGKADHLKWIPFGTLIANVSAACVMAALDTTKKAVNSKNCDTIATGLQFGLMGCLSTVSTFMAEFNAMRESTHPWHAYAYAIITMAASFGMGVLIYDVPIWINGYK